MIGRGQFHLIDLGEVVPRLGRRGVLGAPSPAHPGARGLVPSAWRASRVRAIPSPLGAREAGAFGDLSNSGRSQGPGRPQHDHGPRRRRRGITGRTAEAVSRTMHVHGGSGSTSWGSRGSGSGGLFQVLPSNRMRQRLGQFDRLVLICCTGRAWMDTLDVRHTSTLTAALCAAAEGDDRTILDLESGDLLD